MISFHCYLDLASKDKLDYLLNIITAISDVLNFENIDLKILEDLPLYVQFSMIKDGKVIYELDEERRTGFIENLLQVYYDLAVWYENYLDMTF